jgi:hypothetical protein
MWFHRFGNRHTLAWYDYRYGNVLGVMPYRSLEQPGNRLLKKKIF